MAVKKEYIPPHVSPKAEYLFLIGKKYYRRMMPVPFVYVKPNFKKLKSKL